MDRNDQGYNPSYPSYTFNGRNTNFQFGQPGDYKIQMSSPSRPVTEVICGASPSPGRTQPVGGQGIPRSPFPKDGFAVPATPPPRGSFQQSNVFLGTSSPARNLGASAPMQSPLKACELPRGSIVKESGIPPHPPTPRPFQ